MPDNPWIWALAILVVAVVLVVALRRGGKVEAGVGPTRLKFEARKEAEGGEVSVLDRGEVRDATVGDVTGVEFGRRGGRAAEGRRGARRADQRQHGRGHHRGPDRRAQAGRRAMSLYLRRLLAEFVDREHEMERFCRMLDNPEAFVFVVWGPGGVGKSSLQAKMIHEVANRSLVKSEVIWSETRNHDLMAITRKVRDDLGPKPFEAFTELINFFTVPRHELNVTLHGQPTIAVAEGASFADARVGDIGGVIIKDVMIQEPWRDLQTSESERRARLTDAFLDGAAAALAERTAVIFFDATEKMSAETEKWVWGELLPAVCDGRMGRAKFVLCGRKAPEIDRLLRGAIEVAELNPLSRDYILAYLGRRGVEEKDRESVADMLMLATEGNLFKLAALVDGYLKLRESRAG